MYVRVELKPLREASVNSGRMSKTAARNRALVGHELSRIIDDWCDVQRKISQGQSAREVAEEHFRRIVARSGMSAAAARHMHDQQDGRAVSIS